MSVGRIFLTRDRDVGCPAFLQLGHCYLSNVYTENFALALDVVTYSPETASKTSSERRPSANNGTHRVGYTIVDQNTGYYLATGPLKFRRSSATTRCVWLLL